MKRKKKKTLTPEEHQKQSQIATRGQEAREILENKFFSDLIGSIEKGYDQCILDLNPSQTQEFSFYSTKRDALKDIINNLKMLDAKGREAEKVLSGDEPRKKGLL